MEIGKRIKAKRKEIGMTLEEVGKIVGVSKQTIQRYETGEIANIPYDKLELLAKALHCNGADFFFGYEFNQDKYNEETAKLLTTVKNSPTLKKVVMLFDKMSDEQQKSILTIMEGMTDNH